MESFFVIARECDKDALFVLQIVRRRLRGWGSAWQLWGPTRQARKSHSSSWFECWSRFGRWSELRLWLRLYRAAAPLLEGRTCAIGARDFFSEVSVEYTVFQIPDLCMYLYLEYLTRSSIHHRIPDKVKYLHTWLVFSIRWVRRNFCTYSYTT